MEAERARQRRQEGGPSRKRGVQRPHARALQCTVAVRGGPLVCVGRLRGGQAGRWMPCRRLAAAWRSGSVSVVEAPLRVFVSHTSELRRYPPNRSFVAAAERAVTRAGGVVLDMAYFTAREDKPAEYCRQQVRQADVYVGILGFRYGSLVADDPGRSYTELEFDTADELGLFRLVFVLDEDAVLPLPQSYLSDPLFGERQREFRARVKGAGTTIQPVRSPDRLETLLYQALTDLRSQPKAGTPPARSAYLEQVRRIAPDKLHDRDEELTELAAFCTEPGQRPYAWWRAPAWAGKSALMSWFVLHPPGGVRVVLFFITAR